MNFTCVKSVVAFPHKSESTVLEDILERISLRGPIFTQVFMSQPAFRKLNDMSLLAKKKIVTKCVTDFRIHGWEKASNVKQVDTEVSFCGESFDCQHWQYQWLLFSFKLNWALIFCDYSHSIKWDNLSSSWCSLSCSALWSSSVLVSSLFLNSCHTLSLTYPLPSCSHSFHWHSCR